MDGSGRRPGGRIYLSYRRGDAGDAVIRLYRQLAEGFGSPNVLVDVGTDEVETVVASCDVLLAVIGPGWFTHRPPAGVLDVPALEIATALRRDVAVIPVLVEGARMPNATGLPVDLAPLAQIHAAQLDHATFRVDVDAVIEVIEVIQGRRPTTTRALSAAAPPVEPEPTGHLFVSYAREDEAAVRPLVEALERRHRLWIDTAGTVGGGDWSLQIIEAIKTADALLLLLSARSVRSDAVRKEVLFADNRKVRIIPILTEPLDELPDWYRFHFEYLHRIPAFGRGGVERAVADVLRAVGRS